MTSPGFWNRGAKQLIILPSGKQKQHPKGGPGQQEVQPFSLLFTGHSNTVKANLFAWKNISIVHVDLTSITEGRSSSLLKPSVLTRPS